MAKSKADFADSFSDLRDTVGLPLAILLAVVLFIIVAVISLAIASLVWAFFAVVILLAWNVGVVGIVGAAGGSVSTIGFWTAFGAAAAIGIIKGILGAVGRGRTNGVTVNNS